MNDTIGLKKIFIPSMKAYIRTADLVSGLEPSKKPLNVLVKSIGNNVTIHLKSRTEYYGRMIRADGYMNVMLKGAKEYDDEGLVASYGDVFIRGNNILYINIDPAQPPQPRKKESGEEDDDTDE